MPRVNLNPGYRLLPEGPVWVPPDWPPGLQQLSAFRWFKLIKLLEQRQVARSWREAQRVFGLKFFWATFAWLLVSTEGLYRKMKAKIFHHVLSFLEYKVKKLEIQLHMLGWADTKIH